MTSWQIKQQLEQIKEIEIFCPTWSHPPECNEAGHFQAAADMQTSLDLYCTLQIETQTHTHTKDFRESSVHIHISHINPEVDRSCGCVYHTRSTLTTRLEALYI